MCANVYERIARCQLSTNGGDTSEFVSGRLSGLDDIELSVPRIQHQPGHDAARPHPAAGASRPADPGLFGARGKDRRLPVQTTPTSWAFPRGAPASRPMGVLQDHTSAKALLFARFTHEHQTHCIHGTAACNAALAPWRLTTMLGSALRKPMESN
jgi:hypothetical protein